MRPTGALKGILQNGMVRQIICWLGALYIRFVHATTQWHEIGRETPEKLWAEGRPFIMAFWHGRFFLLAPFWNKRAPVDMLISQHRDGRLIANTLKHFGIGTVAGSTSKGGGQALRQMIRALKSGSYIGITPDGPRGPRQRASTGIIVLARLSGAPIIPVTFAAEKRCLLSSWDRFHLAFPFGRGVCLWGDAIELDDMNEEQARAAVETTLNALTEQADREMGHEVLPPAKETR